MVSGLIEYSTLTSAPPVLSVAYLKREVAAHHCRCGTPPIDTGRMLGAMLWLDGRTIADALRDDRRVGRDWRANLAAFVDATRRHCICVDAAAEEVRVALVTGRLNALAVGRHEQHYRSRLEWPNEGMSADGLVTCRAALLTVFDRDEVRNLAGWRVEDTRTKCPTHRAPSALLKRLYARRPVGREKFYAEAVSYFGDLYSVDRDRCRAAADAVAGKKGRGRPRKIRPDGTG